MQMTTSIREMQAMAESGKSYNISLSDVKESCEEAYGIFANNRADDHLYAVAFSDLKQLQKFLKNGLKEGYLIAHPSNREFDILLAKLSAMGIRGKNLLHMLDKDMQNSKEYMKFKTDFMADLGLPPLNPKLPLKEYIKALKKDNPLKVGELRKEVIFMAQNHPVAKKRLARARVLAQRSVPKSKITQSLKIVDDYLSRINKEHNEAVGKEERKEKLLARAEKYMVKHRKME